jgi:dTDP-4-amino-4,6-dideoxygalactose transaminase
MTHPTPAIPFNRPSLHGREIFYISEAVAAGHLSGDGEFTARCQAFFENHYGFRKTLLTTSCTDALEMSAILLRIRPGDEVIVPSYSFVSTANAFALRGATIVFADSSADHPNIDADSIEALVTPRTRAIVLIHYAGDACDMDKILAVAKRHGLCVIEDAAHAIDSYYGGRPLGTFGTMATLSFHETKNITSGEGGLLVVNEADYVDRAEIIRNKGTDRSSFNRGEVDRYSWVDLGSSFLPAEIIAAYLFAQLEALEIIQSRRKAIWHRYRTNLAAELVGTGAAPPVTPGWSESNGHMFYLECENLEQRAALIEGLRKDGIEAVFHYQSLHQSPYFEAKHDGRPLPRSDHFSDCLVRLPLFYELTDDQVDYVSARVLANLRR